MKAAIEFIEKKYGINYKEKLLKNSEFFFSKIVCKGEYI